VEARHALIKCHLFEFLQLQLSYKPLSAGSNQALGHPVACGAVGCGPKKFGGQPGALGQVQVPAVSATSELGPLPNRICAACV
jgi:hypothetical protein